VKGLEGCWNCCGGGDWSAVAMMWGLVRAVIAITTTMAGVAGSEIIVRQLRIANDININTNNASIVVVFFVLPCPALCVVLSSFEYRENQE
jgi:hypothetical protein